MANLDRNYPVNCWVTGRDDMRCRIRTVWAGDDDLESQSRDLLNSFRNRVGSSEWFNVKENWQCWRSGTKENGSAEWTADITMYAVTPNVMRPDGVGGAICMLGYDYREKIVNSLREHFQRGDIEVDLPGDAAHECWL